MIPAGAGAWLWQPLIALSLRLRERFERALRLGLEDQPRLASVLAGMVIGERSEIPDDTYSDFQRTGVFHSLGVGAARHDGGDGDDDGLRLARVPGAGAACRHPLLALYVFATGCRPGRCAPW